MVNLLIRTSNQCLNKYKWHKSKWLNQINSIMSNIHKEITLQVKPKCICKLQDKYKHKDKYKSLDKYQHKANSLKI